MGSTHRNRATAPGRNIWLNSCSATSSASRPSRPEQCGEHHGRDRDNGNLPKVTAPLEPGQIEWPDDVDGHRNEEEQRQYLAHACFPPPRESESGVAFRTDHALTRVRTLTAGHVSIIRMGACPVI